MPVSRCQAGIQDPPPEHVLVAALNFVPADAPSCLAGLSELRECVRRELAADIDEIDPDTNAGIPTADTGELGVDTGYDTTQLTITVGISSSGFGRLGVAGNNLPQDLEPIPWADFGDAPANPVEGDLVLQICANSAYVVEHVLRRIEHTLAASFAVVWTMLGEQRDGGPHGAPLTADSARSLIGFHDGLVNLNPHDGSDQELIFVGQPGVSPCPPPPNPGPQPAPGPGQPGYNEPGAAQPIFPAIRQPPTTPEPEWATDGTYLMVRGSVFNTGAWDGQTLAQQQASVGRYKYSGATLDNPNSPAHRRDDPLFATNASDARVPLDSHIRRANPRAQPSDALRRIFRRGYPLMLGSAQGTLQRGLLFIAFGRSLSSQAEFIVQGWLKNPNFPQPNAGVDPLLSQETSVVAGGFYFVPPVADPDQPWTFVIPGL
jgi:deferrochelatase/peroxidase EfeB